MADAVTTKWIYPVDYDGDTDTPPRRWRVRITSVSDGTGETDVRKVVIGDLFTQDRSVPSKMIIEKITYDVTGYTSISLEFDRSTSDQTAIVITGTNNGEYKYRDHGGLADTGSGDTGDLLLTTVGHTSGDSYNIDIEFRLK